MIHFRFWGTGNSSKMIHSVKWYTHSKWYTFVFWKKLTPVKWYTHFSEKPLYSSTLKTEHTMSCSIKNNPFLVRSKVAIATFIHLHTQNCFCKQIGHFRLCEVKRFLNARFVGWSKKVGEAIAFLSYYLKIYTFLYNLGRSSRLVYKSLNKHSVSLA